MCPIETQTNFTLKFVKAYDYVTLVIKVRSEPPNTGSNSVLVSLPQQFNLKFIPYCSLCVQRLCLWCCKWEEPRRNQGNHHLLQFHAVLSYGKPFMPCQKGLNYGKTPQTCTTPIRSHLLKNRWSQMVNRWFVTPTNKSTL